MRIQVNIPKNLPDSSGDILPNDFSVPAHTPVRWSFQGEPIGEVVSQENGCYTMEVDESKFPLDVPKLKRLFTGGIMKEDGTFEIRECSITPFSFTDKK